MAASNYASGTASSLGLFRRELPGLKSLTARARISGAFDFTAFATLVQCGFIFIFFTGTIVFADISSNTVCECMVSQ